MGPGVCTAALGGRSSRGPLRHAPGPVSWLRVKGERLSCVFEGLLVGLGLAVVSAEAAPSSGQMQTHNAPQVRQPRPDSPAAPGRGMSRTPSICKLMLMLLGYARHARCVSVASGR